ncbi:MAG: leucyl/phenylalanyl-tRNA--protein transferase [Proteobacteria bacterium]|nr:MAG: leucyl/phenylalanyl-tRNA--protein transferase [Pseudomonadota bacterium]
MKIALTTELLISAYANGYFPMPHPETEEICWFHPDPRAIIPLDNFHVSRTLLRTMKRKNFRVSVDEDFEGVIDACADRKETWINEEIRAAFVSLYREGHCHSVEVWEDDRLVGGTYGIAIRGAFFAESMFHRETDASKVALLGLVNHMKSRGMTLLEVQFLTPHLASLGAVEISSDDYMERLRTALKRIVSFKERKLIQSF